MGTFSLGSQFHTDAGEIVQLINEQVMFMKMNGNQICERGKDTLQKVSLHSVSHYILIVEFLFQLYLMNYIRYPVSKVVCMCMCSVVFDSS